MISLISWIDAVVTIVLLFVIFLIAHNIQEKNIERFAYYSHFKRALFLKIFSGIIFCLVYVFYYGGGDTEYYYTGTRCILRMAGKDLGAFLRLLIGERTLELRSLFDIHTGWPTYFKDANSWAVCRFSFPFYILGGGSYFGMTMVMNTLLFIPFWRFYKMILRIYPKSANISAIAVFYVPSVLFWGSGLLKDGWCLAGVLAIYIACYNVFIRKRNVIVNACKYIFWAYILISIRPYAFYVVFATTLIWIGSRFIKSIESEFLKVAFFPFVAILLISVFSVFINNADSIAEGHYTTIDGMMEQAVIIQDDLKQDYYGNNSFDIGPFDASLTGMLSKFFPATIAGLYRPFIWEARTPFMLLAGMENIILLLFRFWFILKFRLKLISILLKDGFLSSIVIFVVVFAFFIGLTIANFGALVRYRIVLQPFFCLFIGRLWHLAQEQKMKEESEEEIDMLNESESQLIH